MEVDYTRLRNIYRLEKQSQQTLTKLEPDFYRLLGEYLREEREKVAKAREEQDIERLVYFANLVRLVDDFISIRQRKIVQLALASVFEESWEPENMVGWEKDLYAEIVETVRRYREEALAAVGLREGERAEVKEEKALKYIRVKILQEIPEFVGTDYRTYGPYSGGEVVELPPEIAEILLARNLAEVVEDEKDPHAQV